jgi:hypothetical protein
MPILTLKTWNRPELLDKCLHNLLHCRGIENYYILVSVDNAENNNETYQVFDKYFWLFKDLNMVCMLHTEKLGCAGNTKWCLNNSFLNNETHTIHLEDDVLVSPNYLEYMEWAADQLLKDNTIFAASPFIRECHRPFIRSNPNTACLRNWFEPGGGFVITRKRYDEIDENGGVFGVDYIDDEGRHPMCFGDKWLNHIHRNDMGSWGWVFGKYFANGRPTLYPCISRVRNIGALGLHTKTSEFHDTYIDNQEWTGLDKYIGQDLSIQDIYDDERLYHEHGMLNA